MTPILQRAARWAMVKAFGLPEAWFNRVPPLEAGRIGSPVPMPFAQSVWVMRAIKKIAGPISAVPIKFFEGDNEVEDPQLAAFWQKPAIGLALPDFVEATVDWLKLAGESFWIMGDSSLRPFPEVAAFEQLILARPRDMRPLKDTGLEGWEYTDAKRQRHVLLKEQVIHLKYYNPYDDCRGLAEYEAARIATEADYAAGEYQRNLMENNGDTGPIISSKAGGLTDEQQRQIIAQLRMKRDMARRGDFRAAFLTSDVTVADPTAQTVDAAFAAMRLGNRHEIFLAFGVPPSMADKMESYSIGSASDWFILIFETCIPTGTKIAAAIAEVVRRQTGRELTAAFDFDEHPVMQVVRRERLDAAEKLWTKGMPMSEINEYLGLGITPFNGWDVGYLPFSVAPIGEGGLPEVASPEEDTALAEGEEEDEETPVEEAVRALRSKLSSLRTIPLLPTDCPHCSLNLADLVLRSTDSADVRRWKALVAKRRETIRAYQSKFNAVLMAARRQVIAKLERAAAASQRSTEVKAAAADFMFNLDDFTKLLQANMRGVALGALQTAGDQVMDELGKDDPWKMPQAETLMFLKNRENRLAGVPDAIFQRIESTIQDGLTAGESLRKIAANVRAEFNDLSNRRAMTIAQTETAAAYGVGRQQAMEDAGVQWKQWLTSGNANVRAAHRLMNGTTVPIGEPFIVLDPKTGDTDEVMHPADPAGEPWNVINCHCVEIAVAKGPEGEVEPIV